MAETSNPDAGVSHPESTARAPEATTVPVTAQETAPTTAVKTGKDGLGPLIRMRALQAKDLPAHPDLAAQQTSGTQLQPHAKDPKPSSYFVLPAWSHVTTQPIDAPTTLIMIALLVAPDRSIN